MNLYSMSLKILCFFLLFFHLPLYAEQNVPDKKAIDEQAELEREIMSQIGINKSEKNTETKQDSNVSKPKKTVEDKGRYVIEVIEKEIKEEPKKEEKKEISLETQEFYSLKQEYLSEIEKISTNIKPKIIEIAKKYLNEATEQYEQKKKSGNVKGMALARDAKNVFNACVETLEKDGKYVPPDKFRKELEELIGKFTTEVNPIVEKMNSEETAIKETFTSKFKELIKPKIEELKLDAENSEKILKEKLEEFFTKEIKPPKISKTNEKSKSDSQIIASKGMASEWVDVGIWNGEMYGMDVVNIPLNVQEDSTEKQLNPVTGEESILTYTVYYPLPPRTDYALRLIKIKDKYAPDLIDWPAPANGMTLTVRTKPIAKHPASHGFIIQASLPPAEMPKVFNKAEFEKRMALKKASAKDQTSTEIAQAQQKEKTDGSATKNKTTDSAQNNIKVSFSTKPEGAMVFVDDFMLSDENGRPTLTPCTMPVAPGKHEIKFCKLGYSDKLLSGVNIDARNNKISAELTVDPKVKSKKINFPANSQSAKATGIMVKKGESIVIDTTGIWSCGERNDKCGGEGYENNQKFYKYYIDKAKDYRLTSRGNYGAVIFKIGKDGEFTQIQQGREIIASQDGEIFIDINEKPDQRRGNSGSLDINILVLQK